MSKHVGDCGVVVVILKLSPSVVVAVLLQFDRKNRRGWVWKDPATPGRPYVIVVRHVVWICFCVTVMQGKILQTRNFVVRLISLLTLRVSVVWSMYRGMA